MRNDYRVPSTRLSNTLEVKVTEKEGSRIMPRCLVWAAGWMFITEMVTTGERGRVGMG